MVKAIRNGEQCSILRIKVLTLVNRFISLLFMLASPPTPLAPNAGSATALDHPTIQMLASVPSKMARYDMEVLCGGVDMSGGGMGRHTARKESIF